MRSSPARGLEHVHRADDVDLRVERGLLHRRPDVRLRGEVEDDLGVGLEGLPNIVLEERGSPVDVVAAPRREVVEHDDLVAARQQRVHEVRADEPRPTGNERAHPGSLDGLV